jgi:hypothetical protein
MSGCSPDAYGVVSSPTSSLMNGVMDDGYLAGA